MAKYFSFVARNVTPVSQNSRSRKTILRLQSDLIREHNRKNTMQPIPRIPLISADPLCGKVFYIHRVKHGFDADNISKPLWDSLEGVAYENDRQIRYLETLKIHDSTPDVFEIDITEIDLVDLAAIYDFIDNIGNDQERILYVSVSDHQNSSVRFI
ncbi:MAG: RusA family crossover junction endodeoxyribonuclease [Saprospiraceae bacterium]|nr:RusA family crossover junction endodeoxyribonuclease [Saprospiraceae bacterium]